MLTGFLRRGHYRHCLRLVQHTGGVELAAGQFGVGMAGYDTGGAV